MAETKAQSIIFSGFVSFDHRNLRRTSKEGKMVRVRFTEDNKLSKAFDSFDELMDYPSAIEFLLDLEEDLEDDVIYIYGTDIKYADIIWG